MWFIAHSDYVMEYMFIIYVPRVIAQIDYKLVTYVLKEDFGNVRCIMQCLQPKQPLLGNRIDVVISRMDLDILCFLGRCFCGFLHWASWCGL